MKWNLASSIYEQGMGSMGRKTRLGAALALCGTLGLAGTATAASSPGPFRWDTSTPLAGAENHSALGCHLELPVRVRGARFVSSPDGATIACAGVLMGDAITGGAMPQASGRGKGLHHMPQLPPAIRKLQLSFGAVGAVLPMDPENHTAIKLALTPDLGSATGVGHFKGHAPIRRRDHQVAATIAFQPTTDPQLPRSTGRLIIDLALWRVPGLG